MKISCPSCTAKYSIADDKVQNRLAKIRCRKCGTTIVIDGKNDPPIVRAADGAGSDDEGGSVGPAMTSIAPQAHARGEVAAATSSRAPAGVVYTVDVSDNNQRSMTIEQVVSAYNEGTITADTYVWREGMADWEPLADVEEINRALHQAAATAVAPQQPTSNRPAAGGFSLAGGGAAVSSAMGPGRVSSAGLFGGGSAEPARAATRGEVSKDLFGSIDMAGSEYDTRTANAEAAHAKATATGARNESSVLFSLSALTGPDPVAPGVSKKAKAEDSGLIDLAALSSLAAASREAEGASTGFHEGGLASIPVSPLAAPLGVSPLAGVGSPLGGVEVSKPANTNRGAMFIGGGIAIAAIFASAAYVLKEDPPTVAAVPPQPAITAEAPSVAPEPVAAASEAPAEDKANGEKVADGKETKSTGASNRPRYVAPKRPAGGGEEKKPAAAPKSESGSSGGEEKKPAAPPKKKCNCAPSDLMCAMRCSAK